MDSPKRGFCSELCCQSFPLLVSDLLDLQILESAHLMTVFCSEKSSDKTLKYKYTLLSIVASEVFNLSTIFCSSSVTWKWPKPVELRKGKKKKKEKAKKTRRYLCQRFLFCPIRQLQGSNFVVRLIKFPIFLCQAAFLLDYGGTGDLKDQARYL